MADFGMQLRRHLRTCVDLGDPEIFLPAGERERTLHLAARWGDSGMSHASVHLPTKAAAAAHSAAADASSRGRGQELNREAEIARADLGELAELAGACTRCSLSETRHHVVFGEGGSRARVVCVGEAPGATEDATGRPFVGRAGKLLDRLLMAVGFRREEVFICNVLKCRPPGNRNPLPEEIECCAPFLRRQLELISPDVILALGTFAAQTLLECRESIGRLRGGTFRYEGFPLVATYHPAALLRNPGWIRPTWEDLQGLRRVADGEKSV